MNSHQYAALEKSIQSWLDDTVSGDDLELIIGNRTVELMATAARSVFDACEESQQFAKREGYISQT